MQLYYNKCILHFHIVAFYYLVIPRVVPLDTEQGVKIARESPEPERINKAH